MAKNIGKISATLAVIGVVVLLAIQLVPYGKNHNNPAVVSEPNWDSPQTRTIAQRACFDCHSNETTRPWYGSVAPVSWLLQRDIDGARKKFNFSEWDTQGLSDDRYFSEAILSGEMPPSRYLMMHPEAKLTDAEKQQLVDGLAASIK
jgi:cytochrome c551/c552